MRALLLGLLVLMAIALGTPAVATSDGGRMAYLLAVGGKHQRYAIVHHSGIQEGCFGGCETFIVDTHATTFKRLHVASVKEDEDTLAAYTQKLPEAMRKKLEPLKKAEDLPRLTLDGDASKPKDLVFTQGKRKLRVQLKTLWNAPSMQGLDKLDEDAWRPCVDWSTGEATCSSCRRVVRWVDGVKLNTWACSGVGQFPKETDGDRKCDCSARAPMTVLAAKWTKTGIQRRGSKLLIEPYKLSQHSMTGGSTEVSLGGTFGEDGVTDTSIEAVVLEKSILVLGAAVHARYANGTYMPLVAAIPR